MGDITPKPKPDPRPDSDPSLHPETTLGEAPGSSVTMPEIPGWNAATPEPTPPPKGYFPPVDLIEAWRRAAGQAPAVTAPAPVPAAEPERSPHDQAAPVSNRLLILLTVLGLIVVGGLGGAYYLFFRAEPLPQRPIVAPTASPRVTPTPTPTPHPKPSPLKPSAAPAPPAPPPQSANTYTVLPGDTLITIGEKLGKDWRQIAAANGQITDPNFITPGQVLVIP